MNGEQVTFEQDGKSYQGYLSVPGSGSGPGVIVIQEWWGIVDHIKDVCDRFAQAGYVALAPDFYHGKSTAEPDEAGSMMMALNIEDAARVIQGATSALLENPATKGDSVGVVGFCMGGQLSMFAASIDNRIAACVNFYGVHPNVKIDFSKGVAPNQGLFAEHDDYASPAAVKEFDGEMDKAGQPYAVRTYAGTHHAFFNDDRPEVYNKEAAEDAWARVLAFFAETIG